MICQLKSQIWDKSSPFRSAPQKRRPLCGDQGEGAEVHGREGTGPAMLWEIVCQRAVRRSFPRPAFRERVSKAQAS